MKKLLLLFAVLLALVGCNKSVPIYNVIDYPAPQQLSMGDMEKCIIQAGESLGWQMTSVSSGKIRGLNRLKAGKHVATVDIDYTTSQYSIKYHSSSNLKAEVKAGYIHQNYNTLIKNLEQAISDEISMFSNKNKQK